MRRACGLLILSALAGTVPARAEEVSPIRPPACTILGRVASSAQPYVRWPPEPLAAGAADGAEFDARKASITNYLIDLFNFYKCESVWYGYVWIAFDLSIIVLTSAASLLAALSVGGWPRGKYVLVAVSALAAFLTTVLGQFHLKDLWYEKTKSYILAERSLVRIQMVPPGQPDSVAKLIQIHQLALTVEWNSAARFFNEIETSSDAEKPSGQ